VTGERVSAGVGVEDRVEVVDEGCGEREESESLANRIFVGRLVSMSWILSSKDSAFLLDFGEPSLTDVAEVG
jgi:hypothetical protein